MPLKIYFQLVKGSISIFATLSAVAGFILMRRGLSLSLPLLGIFAGTLLLAMGASALNQYQERTIDARMERTRNRPLPSGRITPMWALMIAALLGISGILLLYTVGGALSAALGAFALLWYNGIYTYLKKASAFAVVPGALVGAIPPMIGWVSGGGSVTDPDIIIVSLFFFIWQVPHFWLLSMLYEDDYRRAGLPAPGDRFSRNQLSRITFIWLIATGVASLFFPLFKITASFGVGLLLTGGAFLFILHSITIFRKSRAELHIPTLFRATNLYVLLIILLISLDGLL